MGEKVGVVFRDIKLYRFDEWVESERLLKDNQENRRKKDQIKQQFQQPSKIMGIFAEASAVSAGLEKSGSGKKGITATLAGRKRNLSMTPPIFKRRIGLEETSSAGEDKRRRKVLDDPTLLASETDSDDTKKSGLSSSLQVDDQPEAEHDFDDNWEKAWWRLLLRDFEQTVIQKKVSIGEVN